MIDLRKEGLKSGLRQLTITELERVINYNSPMCLDEFNYNEKNNTFCPLAVGISLDKTIDKPTHDKIYNILVEKGYKVYNTKGIKGNFYTDNREKDLLEAANEVYQEKLEELSYDIF